MNELNLQHIAAILGALCIIAIIFAVGFMNEPKPKAKAKKARKPRVQKPKLADPTALKE